MAASYSGKQPDGRPAQQYYRIGGLGLIEIRHLNKVFPTAGGNLEVLRDINLHIAKGEIFGIIGLSGAGKSTLVR
ncbi:MAG: ATP-binding cassette domain-containing protein, partial [Clostridiaceae bacterium]|nr:ATP-binding cassette domain-containing protein [Clostridiaceae bacterium]